MLDVLILILITLWLTACALCMAVGYYFGTKQNIKKEISKPVEPLSEEEILKAKREAFELENLRNYTGEMQEDFNA